MTGEITVIQIGGVGMKRQREEETQREVLVCEKQTKTKKKEQKI